MVQILTRLYVCDIIILLSKVEFCALSEAGTGSCPAYEKLD